VSFSLVSFSWTSKRKKPARRDAGRKRTDASRLSRKKHCTHSKKNAAQAATPPSVWLFSVRPLRSVRPSGGSH